MNQELLLKIQNLAYAYENHKMILEGINLDIYKGERIAVMGANGAGKSTFFLSINGVLTPHEGQIFYKGIPVHRKNINELRKNVGIVFQDADQQIIASTVQAEVAFGPMNLKLSKGEVNRRVEQALAYMNLTEYKERPPHYLSGGEKKRVSIADIIAMESEMIIFDEPTAALDPLNMGMLEEVLEKLNKESKTLLISTHDVDFAYRWAERILVFAGGKIIADGRPLEVFKDKEILEIAHLKQPVMLEMYELLVKQGYLKKQQTYPKEIKDFHYLLG